MGENPPPDWRGAGGVGCHALAAIAPGVGSHARRSCPAREERYGVRSLRRDVAGECGRHPHPQSVPATPVERVRLEELDFYIPPGLIAQQPVEPRDSCRLLVMTGSGARVHTDFDDLPRYLRPGDLLVINDSRVLPARVYARKNTGGTVELLFLRPAASYQEDVWEALARPSRRLRAGMLLTVGNRQVELHRLLEEGRWLVSVTGRGGVIPFLERYGELPLPPYIHRQPVDPEDYQTVYAAALGSAAAPTAGLHFTQQLLAEICAMGCEITAVTLHVGLDTFRPISEPMVEDHAIHREFYTVSPESLKAIDRAKRERRRLIAVGTTSVRVLETLYGGNSRASLRTAGAEAPASLGGGVGGNTGLYITPGYGFAAVDVLITNFHLPRTSLLALVMAFGGVGAVRDAYREAVARQYRFFSFGDAMLIERPSVFAGVDPTGSGS